MANVYTRTGDDGRTSLPGAGRVAKSDPRIEALGAIDEANCFLGLARPAIIDSELDTVLGFVQQRLFNCGACLASAGAAAPVPVTAEDVTALEHAIDRYSERVGGFEGFVLPGCDEASARLHVARSVLRRAERRIVASSAKHPVDPALVAFINRAADLLFVAAAYVGSGNECRWDPKAPRP